MRIGEVTLRFLDTVGCKVKGKGITQTISFRNLGEGILDQAPDNFIGVKRIENLGWDRGEASLEILQDQPLPFHLLNVIKKITIND